MKFKIPFCSSVAGLFLVTLSLFVSCSKDDELISKPALNDSSPGAGDITALPAPVIKRFEPTSGFATTPALEGTAVLISGGNFNPNPSHNIIKFNGVLASVVQVSPDELVTIVPFGATSGRITITIHGVTAVSETDFIVTPYTTPPIIGGFAPESGAPGTRVSIFGSQFNPKPALNEVKFNGIKAVVTAVTPIRLVATVPPGATTGRITVTANGFTASSATDFVVIPAVPVINSFSPVSGYAAGGGMPGTLVTISGSNFSLQPSGNEVKFNGVTAVVSTATASQLKVAVPEGATTGVITVTANGATATSPSSFTVIPRPIISFFFPAHFSRSEVDAGMAQVRITGFNFSPVPFENIVIFPGNPQPGFVLFSTPTELMVRIPPLTHTGPVTIIVNGNIGISPFPIIIDPFNQ